MATNTEEYFNLCERFCPGLVLIFNHYKFIVNNLEQRDGTSQDLGNLCSEFAKLQFEFKVYQNQTKKFIIDELEKYAKKNYLHYGCLIVIVLTHGGTNGKLYAYDDDFNTCDVWKPFIDCGSLKEKPKIFIFQACRGSQTDKRTVRTDSDDSNSKTLRNKNCLLVYSTVEGYYSYRSTDYGTWYVQSLTKKLKKFGKGLDLLSLLTRVNYRVINDFSGYVQTQTPNYVSTLTKPVTYNGQRFMLEEVEYAMMHEDRGDALILYDKEQAPLTAKLQEILPTLNFNLQHEKVSTLEDITSFVKKYAGDIKIGMCFFIAIMCKIEDDGFVLNHKKIQFSEVLTLIKTSKFNNLAGIPKIVLFLNQQETAHDGEPTVVRSEVLKVATEHSDVLIVKAYTTEKAASIVESLSKCLNTDLVTSLTGFVGADASIESSLRRLLYFRKETPEDVKIELMKNDPDLNKMLEYIEIKYQDKKFAYIRDICSNESFKNLTSSTNKVLVLNYKACSLYHLAKQSTKEKSEQLNLAFATWKDLYENHYTPQLDLHFDEMLECAKLLDNNKVCPNLDWVFSKIKTEQRHGLVLVLQLLRDTRENAKLSKEVALRMSQRISLPQHLREPVCDLRGNIAAPGSVEYISGLEIEHGNNALVWMRHHISLEAVTYLVQNGADVRATGGDLNSTILHEAAWQGVLDVVVYAVQHNVDVKIRDHGGETALHRAAWRGHIEVVKYLISQGADVSVTDNDGWTALHYAALSGHIEVVKYLISQGADVNVTNNKGWTALHHAAMRGHIEVVKYLMSHGAEVSVTSNDGWTALHGAAWKGHLDVVLHLVTSGADLNIKDNEGLTALDVARRYNKPAVAEYLQSLNA